MKVIEQVARTVFSWYGAIEHSHVCPVYIHRWKKTPGYDPYEDCVCWIRTRSYERAVALAERGLLAGKAVDLRGFPRPFVLRRTEDVSGVSGTGDVASGVSFSDGTVVIRWNSGTPSTVTWDGIDDAMSVHGHNGSTQLVWADDEED